MNIVPKTNIKEDKLFDAEENRITEEDSANQQNDAPKSENPMDEQQLRIESLKIATKISKLFDNVQPSDLLEISDKVYNFIQHQNNSGEYDENFGLDNQDEENEEENEEQEEQTPEENNNDEEIDFDLDDEEEPESKGTEKDEENEEKESTSEEGDMNPEDIFDFDLEP